MFAVARYLHKYAKTVLVLGAVVLVAFSAGYLARALFTPLKFVNTSSDRATRAQLFERFVPSPSSSILMVGDSITRGIEWTELFPDVRIINRGIDGDTTEDILARIEPLKAARAQKVFVMIGVNDLGQGAAPAAIAARYRKILDALKAPGTQIYVQSVLFVADRLGLNQKIRALNAELKSFCETGDCIFVDLNASLAPDGFLPDAVSGDGLHLNARGYAMWRDHISRFVSR